MSTPVTPSTMQDFPLSILGARYANGELAVVEV